MQTTDQYQEREVPEDEFSFDIDGEGRGVLTHDACTAPDEDKDLGAYPSITGWYRGDLICDDCGASAKNVNML